MKIRNKREYQRLTLPRNWQSGRLRFVSPEVSIDESNVELFHRISIRALTLDFLRIFASKS